MGWESSTRPGSTRQARTMRARVLREEPICRACKAAPSTQDDHIVGWSRRERAGLTIAQWHARSNHQGLCDSCHGAKTRAEASAARTRGKQSTARPHPGLLPRPAPPPPA